MALFNDYQLVKSALQDTIRVKPNNLQENPTIFHLIITNVLLKMIFVYSSRSGLKIALSQKTHGTHKTSILCPK